MKKNIFIKVSIINIFTKFTICSKIFSNDFPSKIDFRSFYLLLLFIIIFL
jgi:hypothetical protein